MRLDQRVVELNPELSRSQAQRLIKSADVAVNGVAVVKPSFDVLESDEIVVTAPLPEQMPDRPEPDPSVELNIIFESDDVVVLDKPAGLVVHPGEKQHTGTLVNGLLEKYPDIANIGEDPMRPGIVHRLDKDTSGVMIVAKTQESFESLKAQFKNRETEKTYVALVDGLVEEEKGVIDSPIGRSQKNYRKMKQGDRGVRHPRPAKTEYEVKDRFPDQNHPHGGYTLLNLKPKTGRMHQLRVHLASIHHPIVGDSVYGEATDPLFPVPRILLHAMSLTVTIPRQEVVPSPTKRTEKKTFISPLSSDINDVIKFLYSNV